LNCDVICVSEQKSWLSSKSSPASSFDSGEFESVRDKSTKLSSTYNWDQTTTSKPPSTTLDHKPPSTTLDPNSDDFFNSMLADDKKVTTVWLSNLVVSTLGIRTWGPGFDSQVVPLFHWLAALGKMFTHIASPVSQLQETGVQKGEFSVPKCLL